MDEKLLKDEELEQANGGMAVGMTEEPIRTVCRFCKKETAAVRISTKFPQPKVRIYVRHCEHCGMEDFLEEKSGASEFTVSL